MVKFALRWSAARVTGPAAVYAAKSISLTDRIRSGGANADRNRFAISHRPPPTVRKAHFDHGETDIAMFHGGPPLTFNYVLIEATAFVSADSTVRKTRRGRLRSVSGHEAKPLTVVSGWGNLRWMVRD
jgi:hypothetical protein